MSNIPNFCVFVGANGSGKSTIFNVFGFLKDALSSNVNTGINLTGTELSGRPPAWAVLSFIPATLH
jgi:predicted ATPase